MRRHALVALVVACSGDPLKADVEMFCSATVGTTWTSFVDVGPHVAERAKTQTMKDLIAMPVRNPNSDIWQFADQMRELMKKTGVTECKTLDVIVPRKPLVPTE